MWLSKSALSVAGGNHQSTSQGSEGDSEGSEGSEPSTGHSERSESPSQGPRTKREDNQSGGHNAILNRVINVFGALNHFETFLIGEKVLDAMDHPGGAEELGGGNGVFDVREK